MTRESKVGILMSCAFLGLAGTVVVNRHRACKDHAADNSSPLHVAEVVRVPEVKPVPATPGPDFKQTAFNTGPTEKTLPPAPLDLSGNNVPEVKRRKDTRGELPPPPRRTDGISLPSPPLSSLQPQEEPKKLESPGPLPVPTPTAVMPVPPPGSPPLVVIAAPGMSTSTEPVRRRLKEDEPAKPKREGIDVVPLPQPGATLPVAAPTPAANPLPPVVNLPVPSSTPLTPPAAPMPPLQVIAQPSTPAPGTARDPNENFSRFTPRPQGDSLQPVSAPPVTPVTPVPAPVSPVPSTVTPLTPTPAPLPAPGSLGIPSSAPTPSTGPVSALPVPSTIQPAFADFTKPQPTVVSASSSGTQPAVRVTSLDVHTLAATDTFESLSLLYYKSADYARALQAYNQNEAFASASLRAGQLTAGDKVWIPPLSDLQKTTQVKAIVPAVTTASYTVVAPAGENLYAIGRKVLPNDQQADFTIWKLNKSLNFGQPVPNGTKLVMPGDAVIPAENSR